MDWDKQGGAAFPVDTHADSPLHAETGMSLLDWFAGQALCGIMANSIPGSHHNPEETVRDAYHRAGLMLQERDRIRAETEYGQRDAEERYHNDPHRHA